MAIAIPTKKVVSKTPLLALLSLNMLLTEVIPYVNIQTKISICLQCKECLQQNPTVTVTWCRAVMHTLVL